MLSEAGLAAPRHWILGRLTADTGLFYLPTVAVVGLAFALPYDRVMGGLLALLVLTVVDSGHVYTTLWRTYFRGAERKRRASYAIVPLALVAVVTGWSYLQIPYLFAAFAYFTYYHHARQYHGMTRWYDKLNGTSTASGRWVLALTILPLVALHFRAGVDPSLGTESFYLYAPNRPALIVVTGVYLAVVGAWIAWEINRSRSVGFELNRFLSVAFPASVHGICMFFGRDFAEVAFGPLMQHGFTYFLVMGHSVERLQMARVRRFLPGLLLIAVTGALFGLAETGYAALLGETVFAYSRVPLNPLAALGVGLLLMPALSHYIIDAWLWRGGHPDASAIYRARA